MMVKKFSHDYIDQAMALARYDKVDDETFAGRIPSCESVIAYASSLKECRKELQTIFEDWIVLSLNLGYPLPPMKRTEKRSTLNR